MTITRVHLPMEIEKQLNNVYCGQSCMQSVGTYFNKYKSQDEIFRIAREVEKSFKSVDRSYGLKCDNEGTGHTGMFVIAKYFGFNAFAKNKSQFSDIKMFLDQKIPVLINWQLRHSSIGEHGHYSIINGYTIENIANSEKISLDILDPLPHPDFNKYEVDYHQIISLWYDFSGKRKHDKWIAAFFPEEQKINTPSNGLILKKIPI